MVVAGDVVELDQSGLLLVEGMHLQIVLMQQDLVGSIMGEDVRVDLSEQDLIIYKLTQYVLLGSWVSSTLPSLA